MILECTSGVCGYRFEIDPQENTEYRHAHITENGQIACDAPLRPTVGRYQIIAAHPSERAVVWRHPVTGEIRYPAANNRPMPERYRQAGFERYEMPRLHDLQSFERNHGVRNEIVWYDKGTGRGFDE